MTAAEGGLGRWVVGAAVLLAFILVPFVLWEEAVTAWSLGMLERPSDAVVATTIGGLLALDVLLPVPSSVVSTAAGFRFGLLAGAGVSWLGMTSGCLLAYVLGSRLGRGPGERLVGARALDRASDVMKRGALWVLAALRPVPVLAEASVLMAGISRMPFRRFLWVTALANLGTSLMYAWVGARSAAAGSFLLAFLGALTLPGIAMLLARRLTAPGRHPPGTDAEPRRPG